MNIGEIAAIVGVVLGIVRPSIQITKLMWRKEGKLQRPKELSVWSYTLLGVQLGILVFANLKMDNFIMAAHFTIQTILSLTITILLWKRGARW